MGDSSESSESSGTANRDTAGINAELRGHTRRVLIVDDNPALLEGIMIAFQRDGRSIVACRTFEEARNWLLTEDFRCLVTDVRLGAFNGLQLAVIARDRSQEMGIIVFSGFDDPVLREEAAQLKASYLVKPITAEQLFEMIDNC